MTFVFSVGLSSVFLTQVKRSRAASSCLTCHHTSLISSLFSLLLHQRLSLDDGVPVEVVLDVVCSEHAPHLEVSQRQPVLLLLAQLAEMA